MSSNSAATAANKKREARRSDTPGRPEPLGGMTMSPHRREDRGREEPPCPYWPASWPAGPWIVPLFWLVVVLGAMLAWYG